MIISIADGVNDGWGMRQKGGFCNYRQSVRVRVILYRADKNEKTIHGNLFRSYYEKNILYC